MLGVAIDGDVNASPEERRSRQLLCLSHRGDNHQTAFEVVGDGGEMDLDGGLGQPPPSHAAHSGDDERSIRSIVNIDSGDHEHLLALA